jgi:hypothetical protein
LSSEDYSTAEKAKLAISGTNTGDHQDLSSFATNTDLFFKVDKVAVKVCHQKIIRQQKAN